MAADPWSCLDAPACQLEMLADRLSKPCFVFTVTSCSVTSCLVHSLSAKPGRWIVPAGSTAPAWRSSSVGLGRRRNRFVSALKVETATVQSPAPCFRRLPPIVAST
jgi:hypothetical protein